MRPFHYARPTDLAEATGLLAEHGEGARVLAGGTDLIIRLRDGTYQPSVVVDVKRIPELAPAIEETVGAVRISAGTTMTEIHDSPLIQRWYPALAEAARFVGSVQIRNRATLAGNMCNASPAADTAPPLLVYGARLTIAMPGGSTRELTLNDFFVRSGVTALASGELVTAIELPLPAGRAGSAFQRRTRRRGHDLASVTVAALISEEGIRLSYGSLGPRPLLFESQDFEAPLEAWFGQANPSPTSMRASPDYRFAMLRVLADRAIVTARQRLDQA